MANPSQQLSTAEFVQFVESSFVNKEVWCRPVPIGVVNGGMLASLVRTLVPGLPQWLNLSGHRKRPLLHIHMFTTVNNSNKKEDLSQFDALWRMQLIVCRKLPVAMPGNECRNETVHFPSTGPKQAGNGQNRHLSAEGQSSFGQIFFSGMKTAANGLNNTANGCRS